MTANDQNGDGGLTRKLDYSHPLHRASVVVEEAKFGAVREDNVLEKTTGDEMVEVLADLLEQAGLDIDAARCFDDSLYYGRNLSLMLPIPPMISYSVFIDGLLHGIALAAELEPKDPRLSDVPRGR